MTKQESGSRPQTGESAAQNQERRRAVLSAIRQHLAASAPFDAIRNEHRATHKFETRTNKDAGARAQLTTPSLVDRFKEALEAVSGHCVVVPNEDEAAQAVRRIIDQSKPQRIAVSNSELVKRILERVESNALLLEDIGPPALFDCDMGITGAQSAIAETGTLVLESEQERHRLASLVPPVHIALIEASRILPTMSELLDSINRNGEHGLSRTVTLITGPSRTSDIELTLAIGVHGPGELHVIIIEDVPQTA